MPYEVIEGEARSGLEHCGRCRMGFRVGAPVVRGGICRMDEAGGAEFLRCPDCGRRFWADPESGSGGRCAVGVLPAAGPAPAAAVLGARP